MAKQTLNNGEVGLSFRTKLNSMFTELYNSITSMATSISSLTTSYSTLNTTVDSLVTFESNQAVYNTANDLNITDLKLVTSGHETRLDNIENRGITCVNAISTLPSFTVGTTASKLTYFNSITFQAGATTTANVTTQEVTVNIAGAYKIYGDITIEFAQTNSLNIKLFKNGVALTPAFEVQGLGTGKPINVSYHTVQQLAALDVLTLSIVSTSGSSFSALITSAGVSFERTQY